MEPNLVTELPHRSKERAPKWERRGKKQTENEIIRPEELSEWSSTNRIHGTWFQIDQTSARYKISTSIEGLFIRGSKHIHRS